MVIVLISGPPCAGKNHHVAVHRGPLDLVLDQDVLGPQGYRTALEGLHRAAAPRAWVIRCLPGPSRRAAFAEQIGAHEVVHLQPATPVLMERARRRPQPHRHVAAIRAWLAQELEDAAPAVGTSRTESRPRRPWRYGRPHRQLRAALALQVAAGQVTCWRCSKPIAPTDPWDLGHDDENPELYRGAEHAACNRATRTPGRATAAAPDPTPRVEAWWL